MNKETVAFVINNLFKTRDQLGLELAGSYNGESREVIDKVLAHAGLLRTRISKDEVIKLTAEIFSIPGVRWDAEAIADALFCDTEIVSSALEELAETKEREG